MVPKLYHSTAKNRQLRSRIAPDLECTHLSPQLDLDSQQMGAVSCLFSTFNTSPSQKWVTVEGRHLHFYLEQITWSLSYSGANSMNRSSTHLSLLWHLAPLGSTVHPFVLPVPSRVRVTDCPVSVAVCSTGSPYRNKSSGCEAVLVLLTSRVAVVITV